MSFWCDSNRFTVGLVLLLRGVDLNGHCSWCHYLSCVPTSKWRCNTSPISCQVKNMKHNFSVKVPTYIKRSYHVCRKIWKHALIVFLVHFLNMYGFQAEQAGNQYTLMCSNSGKNQTYSLTNPTATEIQGLCTQLCRWKIAFCRLKGSKTLSFASSLTRIIN